MSETEETEDLDIPQLPELRDIPSPAPDVEPEKHKVQFKLKLNEMCPVELSLLFPEERRNCIVQAVLTLSLQVREERPEDVSAWSQVEW